jgi:hypothetical protein
MAMLKCRKCGGEVATDERARQCRSCNELFPFACAVCTRKMRPPLPDYPIERYFNDAGDPLCEDHYQRQCPECSRWFQADENPGFYLCSECTTRRESQNADGTIGMDATTSETQPEGPATGDQDEDDRREPRKSGCGAGVLAALALVAVVARAFAG